MQNLGLLARTSDGFHRRDSARPQLAAATLGFATVLSLAPGFEEMRGGEVDPTKSKWTPANREAQEAWDSD